MISLHPEFLSKNGKKEFAVLPYEEFVRIEELLGILEDLRDLREAKQSEAQLPTVTLEEVKRRLGRS